MTLNYHLIYSRNYVYTNRKEFKCSELRYIKKLHKFKYNNESVIRDLFVKITKDLQSFYSKNNNIRESFFDYNLADLHRIVINNKLLLVFNLDMKISKYVEVYGSDIYIFLMATGERGADIWRENGIRYYMHSNENTKHNEPHVHVKSGEYSASIRISDGKILAGELPRKKKKYIINRVLRGKDELLFCWKTKTNGLQVEISDEQFYCL